MKKNKNNYWQSRIQEQEAKALVRTQKQTEKALSKIYRQCGEQVRQDILNVFEKVHEIRDEDIQVNDFYRNNRYWDLMHRLNELLSSLGEAQISITEPAILDLYQRSIQAVDEYMPRDLINVHYLNANAVDGKQLLFQSWCADGKNFSDRVWEDKKKMLTLLEKELNTCVIQGKSPWESARRISERLEVSKQNAYRLMRTETAHAQVCGQAQRYKELGFTLGKWNASNCACEHCRENDGKVLPLAQIVKSIPAHPNCRCSYNLVVSDGSVNS